MKIKFFSFLAIVLFLISCRHDGYDCFTNPQPVILNLVDSKGHNLIETNELKVSDLKITSQKSDYKPTVNLQEIQNHYIAVGGTGWYNGAEKFDISTPFKNFTIKVISKELTGKCSGYVIEKVDFEGVDASNTQTIYNVVLKD
ncbi:hypothetical protein [Soonwooa sp.]|uniref:hypothetical protein n=1 Tax=Soonwooa sp. TaxID=1938592 RepID=UPI00261497E1|nr:hypothetical protein [Soonwooa sp.]